VFPLRLFNAAAGFKGRGPEYPNGPFLRMYRCPDCFEWADADDFEFEEME
jgi:hypothetical protein